MKGKSMSDYIVWLDSEKAHVFELNAELKQSKLQKENFEHQIKHKKGNHEQHLNEILFKKIAERLTESNKILLMGPGLAKNQFRVYLDEHHTHSLGKHVVGVETCDHPTDNQILAIARKFFAHYDLFNEPILATGSRD
tara:strand:- start:8793 stop:9206 length:414 start_codon:yes stop_codon:yes gene_type:complete